MGSVVTQEESELDWETQFYFIQNHVRTFLRGQQFTDCLFYLEKCLEEVSNRFADLSRPVLQIRILLAKTYFESGQLNRADAVYEEIHSQLGYETVLQNMETVGFLLDYASNQLELSRDDDEIQKLLDEAHAFAHASQNLNLLQFYSKSIIQFVTECFIHDYFTLGYSWMNEAVETLEWSFGSRSIEYVDAVIERSRMFSDLGDEQASLHDIETAIEALFSMHSSEHANLALTRLLSLGQEFNDANKHELAIRCFTRATEFSRKSNVSEDHHRVIGDLNLSRIYSSRGDMALALHHLLEALHILDRQGSRCEDIRINVLRDLQGIYNATGDDFNAKRVIDELEHIRFLLSYAEQQPKSEA